MRETHNAEDRQRSTASSRTINAGIHHESVPMKRILASAIFFGMVSFPAFAALNAGDVAPGFRTQASLNGKAVEFSLQAILKKGPAVVYFYPSAYTGGCNIQAHTFAVNLDKFTALGVSVVGVSLDSIERLNAFSADPDYCGGKFPVASDADGQIARAFKLTIREIAAGKKDTRGVDIQHAAAERTTFVIAADGKIVATIGGVSPVENVNQTLDFVSKLVAPTQLK